MSLSFEEFCRTKGWAIWDDDPAVRAARQQAYHAYMDEYLSHPAPPHTRKLECRMYYTWRDDPEWQRRQLAANFIPHPSSFNIPAYRLIFLRPIPILKPVADFR